MTDNRRPFFTSASRKRTPHETPSLVSRCISIHRILIVIIVIFIIIFGSYNTIRYDCRQSLIVHMIYHLCINRCIVLLLSLNRPKKKKCFLSYEYSTRILTVHGVCCICRFRIRCISQVKTNVEINIEIELKLIIS
jgi:hypothetical protein